MPTQRRDFLTRLAAGAAVALGGSGPAATTLPAAAKGRRPISDTWDMSWADRLRGPYRAVFDWCMPNQSGGLFRVGAWRQEIAEVYGGKAEEVGAVLVIRHRAIPMIMGDAFWERHRLGKTRKLKDPFTGKTAARNPYRAARGGNGADPGDGSSIEAFLAKGGIVLACGFAFGAMVYLEAQLQKKKPAEVRPEVLTQVIPGIVIQPSGFFALLEAQRNGCALFPAEWGEE